MSLDLNQLVRQSTAARIANMSVQTFKYHAKQLRITHAVEIDNQRFYDRGEVESFAKGRDKQ